MCEEKAAAEKHETDGDRAGEGQQGSGVQHRRRHRKPAHPRGQRHLRDKSHGGRCRTGGWAASRRRQTRRRQGCCGELVSFELLGWPIVLLILMCSSDKSYFITCPRRIGFVNGIESIYITDI